MSPFARYFLWYGRIARGTWFTRLVIAALVAVAFGLLAGAVAGDPGTALVAAVFVWSAAAISVQRLHDIGKSAWALLVAIVPIVGPLWLLFQLTRRGVEGKNRYGRDPESRLDYLQVDIAR